MSLYNNKYVFLLNFLSLGCRHGSFQRPGTLELSDDYIDSPLFFGARFSVEVPPARPHAQLDIPCKMLN